jgi:hypothetical protein
MSRAPVIRAVVALGVAVASVWLTATLAIFPSIAGAIGVRVGVPGAALELARAVIPIIVALLVAAFSIRFGIRALRVRATLSDDFARGGKLVTATAWAAWIWVVVELFYRQVWLGGATLFGNLGTALEWSAAAVALCLLADRFIPWDRAPRGVRHLGLVFLLAVGALTAFSAWSHRDVVAQSALLTVAVIGLVLMLSGVRRIESGPQTRAVAELALASMLLAGPIWSVLS